jgi:uncharacterized phage-associated protein
MANHTEKQIADTLIHLSRERGIEVTNLKLQKLMYYSQAWNLAFTREPLFDEEIEAWIHGPVVPTIFRTYKGYRWSAIDCPVHPTNSRRVLAHLASVLKSYGQYTATQLERLTHQEDPWRMARMGLEPDQPSRKVITKDAMRNYYSKLVHGR